MLFYFFSILLSSQTRSLTPGHNPESTEAIRIEATEAKQAEATTRIEPTTSAALPIIRCALSTELPRSRGNLANTGVYKPMLVARLSCNFEFRKRKLRSCNFSHDSTWSWPSGWCIGLRTWLRGFDAQLGRLYDACASLPQKS